MEFISVLEAFTMPVRIPAQALITTAVAAVDLAGSVVVEVEVSPAEVLQVVGESLNEIYRYKY